jgi:dihydrofolate reductase
MGPVISIVVAVDLNYGIGYKGELPWNTPIKPDWENLFKVTEGCKMIMGKNSFLDVNRVSSKFGNFVLSKDNSLDLPDGFLRVETIGEAVELSKAEKEIFVIGGQRVFEEALEFCTNIHITFVKENFKADRFFPRFNFSDFEVISEKFFKKGEDLKFDIEIKHFRRINAPKSIF